MNGDILDTLPGRIFYSKKNIKPLQTDEGPIFSFE